MDLIPLIVAAGAAVMLASGALLVGLVAITDRDEEAELAAFASDHDDWDAAPSY